jgi:hypothetical protein
VDAINGHGPPVVCIWGGKDMYFCKNTFIFIINAVTGIPVREFSCQAFLLGPGHKKMYLNPEIWSKCMMRAIK